MTDKQSHFRWDGPPALQVWSWPEHGPDGEWRQLGVEQSDGLPGAVVLAERDGRLLWVRHRRPVVARELWELPRGGADPADAQEAASPEAAALATAGRELREETGLSLVGGRLVGWVHPDSGLLMSRVAVVAGTASGEVSANTEVEEAAWWDADAIRRAIRVGEVADGISLAALALHLQR